jgi:thiol-disulfide isomerase/thioredoxin
MSTWEDEIREELTSRGLNVWEIEVEDHKSKLERLGVSLGSGVPRVMFYNSRGVGVVYKGDRSADSVLDAADDHIGLEGGGGEEEEDAPLSVSPLHVASNLPATVLYFRHSCGYCVRFLPTFTEFSKRGDVGTVLSVDTALHPDAMGKLNPDASSPGVPHVVYHGDDGTQIPFQGERTVSALTKFVKKMKSVGNNVSFEGGSTIPVRGSADVRLTSALNKLQERASSMLGKRYRRVFEPENSDVTFVGARSRDVVNNDRVYILLSPVRQPRGKPTAHACVYGSRTGELTTKIYVNKDTNVLLRNKRGSGFLPVRETNPYVQALQSFGYHVGLS